MVDFSKLTDQEFVEQAHIACDNKVYFVDRKYLDEALKRLAVSATREQALRRTLRKQLQHGFDCIGERDVARAHKPKGPLPCSCGLDALLAGSVPAPVLRENPWRDALVKRIAFHYSPESVGAEEYFVIDELKLVLRDADAQAQKKP